MAVIVLTQTGNPTTAMQASFAGNVMTVVSLTGTLAVGDFIVSTGVSNPTYITSFGTGTGGTGTYNLSTTPGSISQQAVTTLYGWQCPANWSNTNTIECIGGGGGGRGGSTGTGNGGGGGGQYSKSSNFSTISPGNWYSYQVGAGGASNGNGIPTWFNGTSITACSVGAANGAGGGVPTGGSGGTAGSGTGTTRFGGGNGGAGGSTVGGGGGGGAGGPGGAGAVGGGGTATNGGNGGQGGNGSGGTGGTGGSTSSAPTTGNPGTDINSLCGSGGGGGGASLTTGDTSGAAAGAYGAGGGGGYGATSNSGGAGAQGVISLTYTEVPFPEEKKADPLPPPSTAPVHTGFVAAVSAALIASLTSAPFVPIPPNNPAPAPPAQVGFVSGQLPSNIPVPSPFLGQTGPNPAPAAPPSVGFQTAPALGFRVPPVRGAADPLPTTNPPRGSGFEATVSLALQGGVQAPFSGEAGPNPLPPLRVTTGIDGSVNLALQSGVSFPFLGQTDPVPRGRAPIPIQFEVPEPLALRSAPVFLPFFGVSIPDPTVFRPAIQVTGTAGTPAVLLISSIVPTIPTLRQAWAFG